MPELFRPLTQTFMFPMAMVARTPGRPEQIAAAVRQAAFEIDPVVPVAEMQPYTTMIAGTLGRPRLLSFLLTIFAAAGLGLGLIGVYGVVAYRVRQREREIGIRLALGARPSSMATTVVTQGVQHAIAGIAIGLPAAFLLSRVMGSMVFGVTTHDPLTFTALPILIVAVTTLACYLPPAARRASIPVVAISRIDLERDDEAGGEVGLECRIDVEGDHAAAAADGGAAEADDRHVSPRVEPQADMAIGEKLRPRAQADGEPDIHFVGGGEAAEPNQAADERAPGAVSSSWTPPTIK